jgi:outer membrane protein, heavy metal efflux system
MFLCLDNRIESANCQELGRFVECRPVSNRLKHCRTKNLFILLVLGSLIAPGCRSGKQIKDAEYGTVQKVAKTSWCPAPSDTTEAQQLVGSARQIMIDENMARQDQANQSSPDNASVDKRVEEMISTRRATIDRAFSPINELELDDSINDDSVDATNQQRPAADRHAESDANLEPEEIELATATVAQAAEQNGLGLADLIALALDQNPEIAIARKEIEIACAKIPQAASLADPMVDVISWPIAANAQQTAGGRMTAEIMVSQEVPWKGKRASRVGQAAREVNRLQNQKAAVELKIANEVKQAWYDYWLVSQKIEISQADLAFLNDLLERTKVMYEGGRVGQQDLLRLQSEIGLNAADLASLEADRTQAYSELLRVSNWPPEQQLFFTTSICDVEQAAIPDRSVALAQATAASPELRAIWAEVQRDQWKVTESRLEYYPDLKFSAGWGGMATSTALAPTADGVDNVLAGISFNLPVRIAARDAALRESESQVVRGLRDWERFRNETERDVITLHAILVSLKAQLATYQRDVVPQLNDAIQVMVAGYEVDKSDLSELINLRRQILRLRGVELELQARWCQTRADLTMLMAEVDW